MVKYLLPLLLITDYLYAVGKKEAVFLKCMERYTICRNQQVQHDLDKPKSIICTAKDILNCTKGLK